MSRRAVQIARIALILALFSPLALRASFFDSSGNQRFHRGDGPTNANDINISCSGGDIGTASGVLLRIPNGNLQWDTTRPPSKSGTNSGKVNAIPNPGTQTITIGINTNFNPLEVFTVSNLGFQNFAVVTPPVSLEMSTNGGGFWQTSGSSFTVRVADIPSVATSAAQTLSPTQTVPMTAFTVTESADASNPGIWAITDLRLTIPLIAGLAHVTWSGTPSCSGSAVPTRITANPGFGFEDGGRTIRISVGSDFVGGTSESVTISGLNYVLSATCPDTTFRVGVRTGGAANAQIHRNDANLKTVVGLPSMSSAANQVFTKGDPSTTAQPILITESPGTPKIGAADGIQIIIPPGPPGGTQVEWDQTVLSVNAAGTAVGPGHISATPAVTYPNAKTARIAVINTFGAGQNVTISNLKFTNFGGTSTAANLTLECDTARAGVEATDTATIRVGAPTITSSGAQVFQTAPPGPATVPMATLTIHEDPSVPRIGTSVGRISTLRITIPTGFPMTWEGLSPAITTGKLNAAVSYAGPTQTLILTANADFAAGETATVSGLNFILTPAAHIPDNLQLFMSPSLLATPTDLDSQIIAIGGVATISSAANQAFTTNGPAVVAQPITITDANGVASITAANDIRITIPLGFNMIWDPLVTSVTIGPPASGPSGAAKVNALLLAYEDLGRTAVLNVNANFAINEGFVVSNLRFTSFSDSSPSNFLRLRVALAGPAANTDNKTIAIGKPVISQPSIQVFGTNDPSTAYPTITITDDATTPRITAGPVGGDVRIRIPAAINMTWDTSVTVPTITWLSGGGPKVAGTLLAYEDGGKTAVVDVTAPFVGGDSFSVAGLRVLPGATETGPLPLELEIDNASALANATTGLNTVRTNNRPTIVSTTTLDTDGNGSIDRLIVTFSEPIDQTTSSALNGTGFSLAGYVIANGTPGSPNANSITYRLAESGLPDTGLTPALTYDPIAGNLLDLQGLETNSLTSPLKLDGAAPVIVGVSAQDTDGNGRLDKIVFTFSENLVPGQEDIADWVLIDANGTTNLLAGLNTAGNFLIAGNTLTITLTNADGTAGVPRYRYQDDGLNGGLRDGSGNVVPLLTNNTAPVASAGPNQTLAPTKVTLNGSGSFDPDGQPVTFTWSQTAGPPVTLSDPAVARPSFLATTSGIYTFQVQVSDGLVSAVDSVDITILNVPPVARCVLNQVRDTSLQIVLFGDLSTDINGDTLTYSWAQVGGPAVTLLNAGFVDAFFTPAVAGVHEFELTVTDTAANSSKARIIVRVNAGGLVVPTANAGPDQTVPVGTLVSLDGGLSSTPSGNPLTFTWTAISPPIALTGPATATPSFTPALPGTYLLQLVVTDGGVASVPSNVSVNVFPANRPPVAVATKLSPVLDPIVGQLVTLDSTGSVDPEGAPITYAWMQSEGPSVLLSNLSAARPTFTAVAPGTYEFQLQVTDGANWSLPAKVRFPIKPTAAYTPPTVSVAATTVPLPNGHFDGTAPITLQCTLGGSFTHRWWEQTGGPTVLLTPVFPFQVNTITFTPSVAGVYSFRVTAFDFITSNIISLATIDVVVDFPLVNSAPIANAGTNPTGVMAGQTVTLDGSGSNDVAPGPIGLTAFWFQLSGPPVTITNPSSLQPTFVPPVAGTYVFELIVSDGKASSGPSLVQVDVAAAPAVAQSGGGGGGGCGLGPEPLLLLGLLALARRRVRK